MAQLGKIDRVVIDQNGNVVSGATVEVRKQGLTVNGFHAGGAPPYTITVHDIGGVVVGDALVIGNTATSLGIVTTINSLTQITVNGATVPSLNDKTRLSITTNLPALFKDAQGNSAESNPLTSDSDGRVGAWTKGGSYDIKTTSTGTPELVPDIRVSGEYSVSNAYPTGSNAVAWKFDTSRLYDASDKIMSWLSNAGEVGYMRGDGIFVSIGMLVTTGGIVISAGGLTVTAGGMTVSGVVTFGSAVTISSGGLTLTGDAKFRDKLTFGPAGVEDTNIYRASANTLKTDDSFVIVGKLSLDPTVATSRLTSLGGVESLAAVATLSVTKNIVRLTSKTADISTINIDSAGPGASHDGYPLLIINRSGVGVDLTELGNIENPGIAGARTIANGRSVMLVWNNADGKWDWAPSQWL